MSTGGSHIAVGALIGLCATSPLRVPREEKELL